MTADSALTACRSATEIAAAVARGDSTALAETEAALARIAAREDKVHAWRYLDADLARANAAAVDAALAKGALAGAGVGLKDIIDTGGGRDGGHPSQIRWRSDHRQDRYH